MPFESLVEQLVDETGGVIVSHQRLQRLMRANLEVNTEIVGELLLPGGLAADLAVGLGVGRRALWVAGGV